MFVCVYVCMMMVPSAKYIYFLLFFIWMNINEVTGKYVCMLLQAPGAAKADSLCLYALIMR